MTYPTDLTPIASAVAATNTPGIKSEWNRLVVAVNAIATALGLPASPDPVSVLGRLAAWAPDGITIQGGSVAFDETISAYGASATPGTYVAGDLVPAYRPGTGAVLIPPPSGSVSSDGTMAGNSTTVATSQSAVVTYVAAQVAALIASAPGALNTLDELAAALGDDANYAATITTALAGKQPLSADLTAIAALSTTTFGRALLAQATDAAARTALAIPTVLTPVSGFTDGTGNNRQMFLLGPSSFNANSARMPLAGKVVYVVVDATSARTAGTCTVTAYKNGSTMSISAVLDGTNTTSAQSAASAGTFAAGDRLSLVQSVSGYTPTSAQLNAVIYVQFDPS